MPSHFITSNSSTEYITLTNEMTWEGWTAITAATTFTQWVTIDINNVGTNATDDTSGFGTSNAGWLQWAETAAVSRERRIRANVERSRHVR